MQQTLVETDYHSAHEKPGFVGVYKRRINLKQPDEIKIGFSYWDGQDWHADADTPDQAVAEPLRTSHYQPQLWDDFEWCGVVPPEGYAAITDEHGVITPWAHVSEQEIATVVEKFDNTYSVPYSPDVNEQVTITGQLALTEALGAYETVSTFFDEPKDEPSVSVATSFFDC